MRIPHGQGEVTEKARQSSRHAASTSVDIKSARPRHMKENITLGCSRGRQRSDENTPCLQRQVEVTGSLECSLHIVLKYDVASLYTYYDFLSTNLK